MENFVVSARKYRPATFDTVVGQEHVTRTLINEIKNNQLAQAFLFNGPRGVGKTTCARILAKEINKESIEDKDYDFSYNIFELDAASNNSVEDIRHLNEQVRIPPQVGKYKVYIIDEVHMLSAAAFNAFLKTLEEPPHYAIFILATTERHKILPTILSRCQVFTFNRISVADIVSHLKKIGEAEGMTMEEEALHIIAQKADGALRDALSIFDQMMSISSDKKLTYADVIKNLNVLDYDYYFKVTDAFLQQDISQVLLVFDEILSHGFDGQIFLNGLSSHFRDLMVGRTPETVQLLDVPPNVHQKYVDTANVLSQGFLVNAINIANEFDLGYKASRNQRLHVELALIKMCYIPSLIDSGEKKKTLVKPTAKTPESKPITSTQTKSTSVEESKTKAPAAEDKPQKSLPKRKASEEVAQIGNLDDLLSIEPAVTPTKETMVEEDQPALETPVQPVAESNALPTEEAITTVINQYADKLKAEGRFQHSLFKFITAKPEGNTIRFEMIKQHRIQLEEIKVEFLQFLRKELNSSSLQIEVVEVKKKKEGEGRAYTGQEKFEAMAKKNPALKDLKDKLNLSLR
jgi:DNA polymerase-3 subunit gamma/tau